MKINFADIAAPKGGTLVVGVLADRVLTEAAAAIDAATNGLVLRALGATRFTGKRGQTVSVLAPAGIAVARLLLVGLGSPAELAGKDVEALGGAIWAELNAAGETEATLQLAGPADVPVAMAEFAAGLALGARLRSYAFTKYFTDLKPERKPSLKKLSVQSEATAAARKLFAKLDPIADGVFLARDLVSEPGNILYPETLAAEAAKLEGDGVDIEILDEKKLRKLGMGALLGVGQGSVRPPRLVVMRWRGAADKDAAPIAFVGKGITFDTGGISIKPAAGMEEMKFDMGGAAAVIGTLKALAGRKAKVNAVGVIALAENMPDGNAQRPGDIVTSMAGLTIEVNNTDAEGRLALADALWYTQDRFKPQAMINLATLTGAIVVALGTERAGLFSNNDELAVRLAAAGEATGEKLWRMPIDEAYDRAIDGDAADLKNISGNRDAGSIVAGAFLRRFVNNVPWAHLDIAGTAWVKRDGATAPKGATGFGVRLLDRLVADHYEG